MLFKRDVAIRGIYATYCKALCKEPTDKVGPNEGKQFKIFKRYVDAYMIAPLLGCLYGQKIDEISNPGSDSAGIMADVVIGEQSPLTYVYRVIMLTDKLSNLSEEERINRAFREDTDEEAIKRNMKVYEGYFYGGLELLYKALIENSSSDDDYIDKIYEFVGAFNKDQQIDMIDTDIDKLIK